MKRLELGCMGHFAGAHHCRWRRHTQVGNYRISSVGDLYWNGGEGARSRVGGGPDDFFETMVFRLSDVQDSGNEGCGCRVVVDWANIDGNRYATAGAAQEGHERLVEKYMGMSK